MEQDLQDLLALWLGDHDPGEERRTALLARLRNDADFRRAFAEEIRLLGMLKAAQSPEPRWLRLEDEVGWSARQHEGVEAFAGRVLGEWERRRRKRLWGRLSLAAAAAVLLAAGLYVTRLDLGPKPRPETPGAGVGKVATVIRVDDVQWQSGGPAPREGEEVSPGHLRLRGGRLTLAFYSGVSLTLEGPADVEVLAADRVFFHYGKLRARVSRGAEGFTVVAAGYEVVDLGTEFALNRYPGVYPGGKTQVMVFEGEAAVSVLGKDGRSVHGALLERRRSVEIDPVARHIYDVPPRPESFVPLGEFVPAPLELSPGYPAEILAAKPWGYWRFETLVENRVPNEVAGGRALRALGGVALEHRPPGVNRWARFLAGDHSQAFLMDGEWAPSRADGYAIELWVQADLPSLHAFSQTALVGLIAKDERWASNHVSYLELGARSRRFPHEPCTVRFLDRWPAAMTGGSDVFSRREVVPSQWHHFVGQKSGKTLELYVDGERVGTSPASPDGEGPGGAATTACRLLVGRLKQRSLPPHYSEIRPFEGRLDELAVYNHPLKPEEIRRHAGLRNGPVAP